MRAFGRDLTDFPQFHDPKRSSNGRRIGNYGQDGPRTVGFLPFQRTGRGVASIRACITSPDIEWSITDVMRASDVDVFEYEDLVGFQQDHCQVRHPLLQAVPMIDLTNGWDVWLQQKKSSSRFKRVLRKERNLAREIGDIDFDACSNDHAKLDLFMNWKSQHFERTGHTNRFADTAYRAMVHELLDTPTERFSMSFLTLSAGDRIVAMETCLTANSYVSAWQTTHDPDPELDKFSCGMVLSVRNVEAAAAAGAARIDLGVGANPYKDLLQDYSDVVIKGWSQGSGTRASMYAMKSTTRQVAEQFVERKPRLRKVVKRMRARRLSGASTK